MLAKRLDFLRQPFLWWVLFLGIFILGGLVAAFIVFTQGLHVTNLTDLVPWGLWIGVDLSSIALSAGAFLLSAAVYLLGLKQFQPVARTAVFVGLIGYSMACMMLLLDIGRPERFWHGFVFWNIHSPLWEVTMCVGLYFTVLMLEVTPIIGQASFLKDRWPRVSHLLTRVHVIAPVLAVLGLLLSMLHQSSLGATYGVLKARPFWYKPGLAVLFMASAIVAGPALTVLASKLAARVSSRAVVKEELLDKVSKFIGWALVIYLYLRFWDLLSMNYTYQPGRSEALEMLTTGPFAFHFWGGEILLGIVIPMVILLSDRLRRHARLHIPALVLVVGGLAAYRWNTGMVGQLVVMNDLTNTVLSRYTAYVPSLIEIAAAVGVIAYGVLAFSIGVRYLRIVDHELVDEHEDEPVPVLSAATD